MCQMLHTKAEDLRIHNFVDEEHPELLEDEEKTIDELGFTDNHKLLIESEIILLTAGSCLLCCHGVCDYSS